MKVTIEFSLPDDQEAYDKAAQWQRVWSVIGDMDHYLRTLDRGKGQELTEAEAKAVNNVRIEWLTILDDNHVRIV